LGEQQTKRIGDVSTIQSIDQKKKNGFELILNDTTTFSPIGSPKEGVNIKENFDEHEGLHVIKE